jgi:hypothetical protein
MKKFAGLFVGSGAARKICIGFVPDKVIIQNVSASDVGRIEWSRFMASKTTAAEGILTEESSGLAAALLTAGAGVRPYVGGEDITSATAAVIMPVHMIPAYAGDMRAKGTLGLVDAFVIDTAANRTGHFNRGVSTTHVGVGSRLLIGEEWYTVQVLTNDGDAADEVTLDRAAPSGEIKKILFPYDLYNAPVGQKTMAGIVLAETGVVNVSAELCYIEAECFGEL